jgi:tRNA-2-methylthio-N6-dimethylallyladenosine synthase
LFEKGYKEVTLLGQNVDSYHWSNEEENVNFAQLLERVAMINPLLRVRFSTSHPKDITDEVLETMAKYENICKCIHLPVQSGSTTCLERMNRTYSREWYMNRVDAIRRIIPECAITSDVIAGFCGETEEEHADTLSMMDFVKYDMSYMFKYSERPGTFAARKYTDDISEEVKSRRLDEIIAKQSGHALERNKEAIGFAQKVLVEGFAKKGNHQQCGRNTQNKMVVFPTQENVQPGDYVMVNIDDCSQATLFGSFIEKL